MATIVLAPGLVEDGARQAEALSRAGHDVAVVVTTGPSFAVLVAAVSAAAAHTPGEVVVVGRSFGAAAALGFARRHPERCAALVLVDPPVLYGARTELAGVARVADDVGLDVVWQRLTGEAVTVPAGCALAASQTLRGLAGDTLLDGPDDLAAVSQPTLVVAAAGDTLHPIAVAEAYWRHVPTSRLLNETRGDVRLWDRPDDLAAAIGRFLREVLR